MTRELSADGQVIILLTASIGPSSSEDSLTQTEYNEIARILHENSLRPRDLVSGPNTSEVRQLVSVSISQERLNRLLERQLLLATEMTNWQTLNIWVVTRADDTYPHILRSRMHTHAPATLFGVGDIRALDGLALGVVGSRNANEEALEAAENVGRLAAAANVTIVSGGARGVDRAAMSGALESGGIAIGYLSDGLAHQAVSSGARTYIQNGQLTLISSGSPSQTFKAWRAMDRNKLIYAQSFATLVVESDYKKGGTWSGAKEQLKRYKYCDVYVRESEPMSEGRSNLERLGARRWTADNVNELRRLAERSSINQQSGEEDVVPEQLTWRY